MASPEVGQRSQEVGQRSQEVHQMLPKVVKGHQTRFKGLSYHKYTKLVGL